MACRFFNIVDSVFRVPLLTFAGYIESETLIFNAPSAPQADKQEQPWILVEGLRALRLLLIVPSDAKEAECAIKKSCLLQYRTTSSHSSRDIHTEGQGRNYHALLPLGGTLKP